MMILRKKRERGERKKLPFHEIVSKAKIQDYKATVALLYELPPSNS